MLPNLWPRLTSSCLSEDINELIWHRPLGLSLVSNVNSFLELFGKENTWICLLRIAINLRNPIFVNFIIGVE